MPHSTPRSGPQSGAPGPQTYTTTEGVVFALADLTPSERRYLDDAYAAVAAALAAPTAAASRRVLDWSEFNNATVYTPSNPALRATNGFVTRAVSEESTLFRALYDLNARLAMTQGMLRAPDDDGWRRDPFADTFVTVTELAEEKAVSRAAVHAAIKRGDLVGVRPPGAAARGPASGLAVSRNSAAGWEPSARAQAAGRSRTG